MTRIAKYGHDGAVAAVSYSMAQGYNGVYEDKTATPADDVEARMKATGDQVRAEFARMDAEEAS